MFLLTAPTERPSKQAKPDAPPLSANVLPPPDDPPPAILPPPTHPPTPSPALRPVYAPMAYGGAPPPRLPPPPVPPPTNQPAMQAAPAPRATIPLPGARRAAQVTIAGEATAVPRPMAQDDRKVTSMVPAAVRVRREQAHVSKPVPAAARRTVVDASFGLAPTLAPRKPPPTQPAKEGGVKKDVDSKYAEFMSAMGDLGAFDG